jgi:hypothetical protein
MLELILEDAVLRVCNVSPSDKQSSVSSVVVFGVNYRNGVGYRFSVAQIRI